MQMQWCMDEQRWQFRVPSSRRLSRAESRARPSRPSESRKSCAGMYGCDGWWQMRTEGYCDCERWSSIHNNPQHHPILCMLIMLIILLQVTPISDVPHPSTLLLHCFGI